jgi:hypothetical protein
MHTILTHFHLDSIFHYVFNAIAMLPKRNQSLGRFSHQRKTGEFLKPSVNFSEVNVLLLTAQPQAPAVSRRVVSMGFHNPKRP